MRLDAKEAQRSMRITTVRRVGGARRSCGAVALAKFLLSKLGQNCRSRLKAWRWSGSEPAMEPRLRAAPARILFALRRRDKMTAENDDERRLQGTLGNSPGQIGGLALVISQFIGREG